MKMSTSDKNEYYIRWKMSTSDENEYRSWKKSVIGSKVNIKAA